MPIKSMLKNKMSIFALSFFASILAINIAIAAPAIPQLDSQKHLGVANCASATCHGAVSESTDSNVLRNEYRTWSKHDKHAQAYKVLQNERSKEIANKLGIGDPTKAKECLNCHADNVAESAHGPKFQISDGIGCEACHGGSENWIKSHTDTNATHAKNLAAGMYPTEEPNARAQLCLSCHLGTENQFATHRIMGAGHPRMSFELDTFTVLQPAHYNVDADYQKRKGEIPDPTMWAVGQVQTGKRFLELMNTHWFKQSQLFPEISFYDCHACHHPMNDLRWQPTDLQGSLTTGTVRLNDAPFTMLKIIANRLDPALAAELTGQVRAWHKASQESRDALVGASKQLDATLDKFVPLIKQHQFNDADLQTMINDLFATAGKGEYRDYTSAEQAVMAIDMMVITLKVNDKVKKDVDKLYELVSNENQFKPSEFTNQLRATAGKFSHLK